MSHLICPRCSSQENVSLVISENKLICPQCASNFNSLVKIAQTGGTNSFAPGSSPMGGGYNPGGRSSDNGLDSIMGRTRFRDQSDLLADPKMTIEKLLESQHVFAEEDAIPYNLTPQERKTLKIKQELQRRRRYYEEAARSIQENSVAYIKKHFMPTEQQMRTLEESLAPRHLNKNIKHEREDQNPPVIQPQRRHDVLSSVKTSAPIINHGTNTVFGPHDDDDEPEGSNVWDRHKLDQPFTGNSTVLNTQSDLERYLDTVGGQDWGAYPGSSFDMTGPNESTLMDFISDQEAKSHQVEHTDPIASPIQGTQDTTQGLESKLRQQNWQKTPVGLPQELQRPFNWDDWGANDVNENLGPDTSLRTPAQPKI